MTCGFCGRAFEEDRGQPACRQCPLAGLCRFVRCPSCGYENPAQPAWLGRLRKRAQRSGADGGTQLAGARPQDPAGATSTEEPS